MINYKFGIIQLSLIEIHRQNTSPFSERVGTLLPDPLNVGI